MTFGHASSSRLPPRLRFTTAALGQASDLCPLSRPGLPPLPRDPRSPGTPGPCRTPGTPWGLSGLARGGYKAPAPPCGADSCRVPPVCCRPPGPCSPVSPGGPHSVLRPELAQAVSGPVGRRRPGLSFSGSHRPRRESAPPVTWQLGPQHVAQSSGDCSKAALQTPCLGERGAGAQGAKPRQPAREPGACSSPRGAEHSEAGAARVGEEACGCVARPAPRLTDPELQVASPLTWQVGRQRRGG